MPLPSDLPQWAFQYLHSPYGNPVSALDIRHSHRLQAALPTVASHLLELQVEYCCLVLTLRVYNAVYVSAAGVIVLVPGK